MRIALCQLDFTVGDISGNVRKVLDALAKCRDYGAEIFIFPELALSGYPPEDLLLKKDFIRDVRMGLDKIAGEVREELLIIGFPERRGDDLYNSAAILNNGRIAGTYKKACLPNYGVFDEKRYFTPGSDLVLMDCIGLKIGVNICEDIWVSPGVTEQLSACGADLIVNISASPYHRGKIRERIDMLSERAVSNRTTICYLNTVGGQDELVFDGGSAVLNDDGELILRMPQFEECIACFDFVPKTVDSSLINKNRVDQLNAEVIKVDIRQRGNKEKILNSMCPDLGEEEEVFSALKTGLRDYVYKNGFKKVVVGVSGGIDSALTVAIAAEALGKENVVGATMPSRYTSIESKELSKKLFDNLGVEHVDVPIDGIFQEYLRSLESGFAGLPADITEENIQARIRGNILMAFSNKFGYLVLNTGNKSEVSVGYCTLYGDMAGGFAVLKDVLKTWVYKLANYYNKRSGFEAIPPGIISREPTAELKFNQKDSDAIPPYRILDPILDAYIEDELDVNSICTLGFDRDLVRSIINKVDQNEYKRRQAPPGIKITVKAFGRDRRFPITNRFSN
jgi:NAD+ synthase (glutamine-hydrolysing)